MYQAISLFLEKHERQLDRIGALLSFTCALHCAFQPIFLMALPLIGLGGLLNERVESYFLAFSVILASLLVWSGTRHHGSKRSWPFLGLGVLLIIASRLAIFESFEMPLAVSGALGITLAHALNLRLHRHSSSCSHTPESDSPSEDWNSPKTTRSLDSRCLV